MPEKYQQSEKYSQLSLGNFSPGETPRMWRSSQVKITYTHVKVFAREWMNEAIMLMMLYSEHCALTQESHSFAARPPVPPLVTLAPRALLTLVELTLSHSGGSF